MCRVCAAEWVIIMKKWSCAILAGLLIFSLAACGKTTPPDSSRLARMLRRIDIADIAAYLLSTPANVHIQDLLVTPWNY